MAEAYAQTQVTQRANQGGRAAGRHSIPRSTFQDQMCTDEERQKRRKGQRWQETVRHVKRTADDATFVGMQRVADPSRKPSRSICSVT
jgi:hypothetical protein